MYQHFGKAIVRTPLFPLTDLIVSREGEAELEKLLFQRLDDPVFLESLYWASPDFYRQAVAFREGKLLDAKKKGRILHTLKKYIIRASSRCTPYGIFAGCTMRYLVPENKTLAGSNVERRRRARVDVGLLQAIIGKIERDDNIVPFLHYRINPSLYTIADSYRYMEAQLKDGRTHYQLSTIERTELLDEICYLARIEALSFTQLSDLIGYEESESDKQAFVKELLAMQFLVSDLAVQMLGDRQLDHLISRLRTIAESCSLMVPYLEVLLLFRETMLSIEQSPLGEFPVEKLEPLESAIKQLGISWQGALLQVDLYGDPDNSLLLKDQSIKDLWSGVEALSRFTPKRSPAEEELRKFKKLFLERYEFQEVPLLEVLDAELGIGFPVTKGIGNIAYNAIISEELRGASDFRKQGTQDEELWHSFLQKRCEQLFLEGQDELVLKDEDIKGFAPKTNELANTVSVMCSFSASGACYIQHVGGSTANALLGRFSYLHPTVKELTDTIAQKETQLDADAVLAEIVCLPQGRVGNVLRRCTSSN
ncbi:lantibiotic dehydratase family protein [Olivibacter sp. XZL3]|uniref:lantibiotic dehydratase family protein n=1 Tax=Olivibacter sp. XZL3 TaxID=1735116 RepID=UPI0010651D94|nr:lantibiotic dehydratase family protein [Olivibacter sp. XZL3]